MMKNRADASAMKRAQMLPNVGISPVEGGPTTDLSFCYINKGGFAYLETTNIMRGIPES